MKRIIALLLCLALAAGLLGCTPQEEENTSTLQVGFSRTDITPQYSVQLHGYPGASNRWSTNVLDPLCATCIAFTDAEGNTILLYTMDLLYCFSTVVLAKRDISKATGVPTQNIMIATTHTHSAPDVESKDVGMVKYVEFMQEQMVAAAVEAMADRKPAEMYTTSTRLKNMNFVRHYIMNDGSVVGDNFGDPSGKSYVKHMREADNEMQLVRFKRQGGKDVVLVNWQVHPHRTGGARAVDISADLVGAMRMAMEPELGCHVAYFSGASGDLNPFSRIGSEKHGLDYLEQGAVMAKQAILAMDTMTKKETGKVQLVRQDQEVKGDNASGEIMLHAFSIGDVAFVTAPYEMFDTNGMYVKENSPFDNTFVLSNATAAATYIPAEWAYYDDQTSYEVGKGNYEKGTGELLAETLVEMLNGIYPTRK